MIIRKIKKAFKDPKKASRHIFGKRSRFEKTFDYLFDFTDDMKYLNNLESILKKPIGPYYDELKKSKDYKEFVKKIAISEKWDVLGVFGMVEAKMLYVICRSLEPKIIIETGVASGLSSSMILLALKKNGIGTLYSIDLPPSEELNKKIDQSTLLPENKRSGWLVLEDIKDNWNLILGDSKIQLPKLLKNIKNCDIFLHDSDHSYENMMWEFSVVWPYLNGVLLSDDVKSNSAFDDFSAEKNILNYKLTKRLGFLKK